ncbi:MAG: DUF1592 domain-containing protein [Rhodospirillaceae bacterium]|nr:DUF1592 domain-containing protein [Rhodospirillaceae bacterium]
MSDRPPTVSRLSRGVLAAALIAVGLAACEAPEPEVSGAPPSIRRLTETQYRNTIADLFGPGIRFGGHFDPLVRTNGLLSVGARTARITPAGLEQYDRMARTIAGQVVGEANRGTLVPCVPAAASAPDDACATKFFAQVGRMLFRRPLTEDEIALPVQTARAGAATLGSFYDGLAAGLAGMLVNPSFLFVIEDTEPDPDAAGGLRLTAYAKAARLSYFLWNTTPDPALLDAAAAGELHTKAGLARQIDRMLASPQLDKGMRAFFTDMLAIDDVDRLEKDSIIYPAFSAAVARDAKEQTLRTITHLVLDQDGDYRDIFTTRKTFISGPLGRIYRVPVTRPDGGWMAYEFPEGDPRAGLLTQVAFAALHSHPGRSSPTLRGKAVREALLCQRVPDPPGDVDFSLFNDPNSPNRTARERLTAHNEVPSCAGCHKLTDPIGLAMEKIDGAGQLRDTEAGVPIDTSGDLDGVPYADAPGLGRAMRENPAVPACVVNRLFAFGTGRAPQSDDNPVLAFYEQAFAESGYKVRSLLRMIATSDAFFAILPAEDEPSADGPAATNAHLNAPAADPAAAQTESKS